MHLSNWDIASRCICANDLSTQSSHGFGQQTAAAADVQNTQSVKRLGRLQVAVEFTGNLAGDIIQSTGIKHMQRLKLAVLVPPFGGHGLKLFNLGGVNGALWRLHSDLSVLFWA